MRNIMKEAHKMAKEITTKYNDVDYKTQLSLCLSYLASQKEEEVKMVELKGSEKQVKWANDIREVVLESAKYKYEFAKEFHDKRPGKIMRVERLNKAKGMLERVEKEESAKFFIDYFKSLIDFKKEQIELLEYLVKDSLSTREELEREYYKGALAERFTSCYERIK